MCVGMAAAFALLVGRGARWLAARRESLAWRWGSVGDALATHMTLPATVMLALVTAALVAVGFLNQVILESAGSAFAPWATFKGVLDAREGGLNVVYLGVGGLTYAAIAFVLSAARPRHMPHKPGWVERVRQVGVRWSAIAAGVSAAATVAFVPAMLGLLMSVFQLGQELPEGVTTPSKPNAALLAAAVGDCAYLLPYGGEACTLLGGLDEDSRVPCDELPIEARPLLLVRDANPGGYARARYAPHLVCTWTAPGEYVAGETIPAGDLRAMNGAVSGAGHCRFHVFDEHGNRLVDRSHYEQSGWGAYALLRLGHGDTIVTGGCGWVRARHADLGTAPDGTIGVREHAGGWSHPLVLGVDIEPGWVQIECPYRLWDDAVPDDFGSWAAALDDGDAQWRNPSIGTLRQGVVWPRC